MASARVLHRDPVTTADEIRNRGPCFDQKHPENSVTKESAFESLGCGFVLLCAVFLGSPTYDQVTLPIRE